MQGATLREAGADSAFLLRVMQNPTLALAFKLSREVSAYALEEEAITRLRRAADDPKSLPHGAMTAISRLVEQLRWSSEKRHPSVYSAKAALNLTVPIQINTSLDMGDGGATSAPGFANIYELKAEVIRDADHVPADTIREMGGLDPPEASVVGTPTARSRPRPATAQAEDEARSVGVPANPPAPDDPARAPARPIRPRPRRAPRKVAPLECSAEGKGCAA